MLSLAHKFLFIHIPKTAGNSIQRVLLPYSEDRMALVSPYQDGVERFEIRSPTLNIQKHSTLPEYREQLPPDVYASLFKFTCIRNPWDRCVSHFFSPHRGEVIWSPAAFGRFIEETVEPAEQYLQTDPARNPFPDMDAILRFESLSEDLRSVCEHVGIQSFELPVANASRHAGYRDYYKEPYLKDLVLSRFRREIEYFGYSF